MAAVREEADMLNNTLREVVYLVKQDTENTARQLGGPGGEIEDLTESMLEEEDSGIRRSVSPSRASRLRSVSPTRARSPALADNAIATVNSCIHKRNLQLQVSNDRRLVVVVVVMIMMMITDYADNCDDGSGDDD